MWAPYYDKHFQHTLYNRKKPYFSAQNQKLKVTCRTTLQMVHWYDLRAREINTIKIY